MKTRKHTQSPQKRIKSELVKSVRQSSAVKALTKSCSSNPFSRSSGGELHAVHTRHPTSRQERSHLRRQVDNIKHKRPSQETQPSVSTFRKGPGEDHRETKIIMSDYKPKCKIAKTTNAPGF